MNDDLFNYLVATDELDNFLGYEPKCPNCGSKLLEIVYGMPDSETGEKAMNGELFLGDNRSGYNLPDTPENREYILEDFERYNK